MRRLLPLARLMLGYFPLPLMRWLQNQGRITLPENCTRRVIAADNVPCEWLIPDGSSSDQVLLYLHGGGFVYGWSNAHRQMVLYLAQLLNVRALAVDYRLAPEYPYPAALDDCVAVYRWLIGQGIAPENIVITGDSAGGQLTLATLLKLRDDGDPLPAAGVCLSPAADLTIRDELYERTEDLILHPRALANFRSAYVGSHDASDPLLSPVYGDFHGLPPLLIHIGADEFLRADAERAADQAKRDGVDVRIEVYPRMWHVWHMQFANLPQAIQALDDVAGFIKSHLKLPVPEAQAVSKS
ncbi:MAG TPA: alpha/beta hydrolase [Phototrophicaceae bacterium]|nr:alpha/beta hydrolase [Phototrophicaceae bacterium]